MRLLENEIARIIADNYELAFRVPTTIDLQRIRNINRDRSASELARVKAAEKGLANFLTALKRGDISLDAIPVTLREQLLGALRTDQQLGDEDR